MATRNDQEMQLDEQLCFSLYAASRAMTSAYRDRLSELGLTYTQYIVVLLLLEHHLLPMHEVGRRLHLDSATLSPLLKRMESQGLVTRTRSVEDERVVLVQLTPQGRSMRTELGRLQVEVQRCSGMTRGDLMELKDQLNELTGNLRDSEPEHA
ncbi:MarR family winged helix-turn-helix transcriptional regulator [Nocardioides nanhaiensis]|uniref:MarR family transcriptional regulator n=1 Tax=Nocardioides nanhaiensis TaxID=1476871 RepID=A0ABP8VPH7_9ACTN